MFWFFTVGIISVSTLAMQNKVPGIDYSLMFAGNNDARLNDRKVLVLSPDLAVYRNNKAAGFFPEWSITEDIFSAPGFYENVVTIYNSFQVDPPDVIIDPNNLMQEVFRHMPDVARKYKRDGELWVRG